MSILVDQNTRLLVQGITGREGSFHAERCMSYGTNLVAGVTPGKGGEKFMDSVPVFNSVQDAVDETGANVALIFVPPPFASDAILEAADAELPLVVCITEGVPVKDSTMVMRYLKDKNTRLLGPNCPGLITPGTGTKIGIMPGNIHMAGKVGVVSRSGTLTYEAVDQLTKLGIGQSTCVGIGGDPVSGTTFLDVLDMFNQDPETEAIVMIGEIGGTKEQEAAAFIKQNIKKPVASLIVGQTAPAGRRMGHAGAVITGKAALASEKMQALKDAGCHVIATPAEIGSTVKAMITG
ncbi:MAG: succinate--CoA ligase subunit alpha [Dehalococcoidia bacterium]|jgi:succinyl-CoA synthetase alpha subunit|nr:succinate--CoA ligase subunit alpha [Dehalococcoidia bacterium]|tara:strand:- start:8636 stop:9514 length:879 start_codon:yes stop_codon:yes gene_type:complete